MAAILNRGRLTPEEVAQVEQLARRGWKAGRIALKLERLPTTISYAMTRLALRAPVTRDWPVTRNGKPVVFFTPDEDAFIEASRAEGATCQKIAASCLNRFGRVRSAATINLRLKMLANKSEVA